MRETLSRYEGKNVRSFKLILDIPDAEYPSTTVPTIYLNEPEHFLSGPDGLGLSRSNSYMQLGDEHFVTSKQREQRKIKGKMIIISDDPYAEYSKITNAIAASKSIKLKYCPNSYYYNGQTTYTGNAYPNPLMLRNRVDTDGYGAKTVCYGDISFMHPCQVRIYGPCVRPYWIWINERGEYTGVNSGLFAEDINLLEDENLLIDTMTVPYQLYRCKNFYQGQKNVIIESVLNKSLRTSKRFITLSNGVNYLSASDIGENGSDSVKIEVDKIKEYYESV